MRLICYHNRRLFLTPLILEDFQAYLENTSHLLAVKKLNWVKLYDFRCTSCSPAALRGVRLFLGFLESGFRYLWSWLWWNEITLAFRAFKGICLTLDFNKTLKTFSNRPHVACGTYAHFVTHMLNQFGTSPSELSTIYNHNNVLKELVKRDARTSWKKEVRNEKIPFQNYFVRSEKPKRIGQNIF